MRVTSWVERLHCGSRLSAVDLLGAALIGAAACTTTAVGALLAKSLDPFTGNLIFAIFLAAIIVQIAFRAIKRIRTERRAPAD